MCFGPVSLTAIATTVGSALLGAGKAAAGVATAGAGLVGKGVAGAASLTGKGLAKVGTKAVLKKAATSAAVRGTTAAAQQFFANRQAQAIANVENKIKTDAAERASQIERQSFNIQSANLGQRLLAERSNLTQQQFAATQQAAQERARAQATSASSGSVGASDLAVLTGLDQIEGQQLAAFDSAGRQLSNSFFGESAGLRQNSIARLNSLQPGLTIPNLGSSLISGLAGAASGFVGTLSRTTRSQASARSLKQLRSNP